MPPKTIGAGPALQKKCLRVGVQIPVDNHNPLPDVNDRLDQAPKGTGGHLFELFQCNSFSNKLHEEIVPGGLTGFICFAKLPPRSPATKGPV